MWKTEKWGGVLIYILEVRILVVFDEKFSQESLCKHYSTYGLENVCKYVKSNSNVISNSFSTIGIGAGQPSRVDSCEIAVKKAKSFQKKKLKNSVAASDAFFPFPDGVKNLITAGVKVIVQPGGSIRDSEAIKLANKSKVKMIFTGVRHFYH